MAQSLLEFLTERRCQTCDKPGDVHHMKDAFGQIEVIMIFLLVTFLFAGME